MVEIVSFSSTIENIILLLLGTGLNLISQTLRNRQLSVEENLSESRH